MNKPHLSLLVYDSTLPQQPTTHPAYQNLQSDIQEGALELTKTTTKSFQNQNSFPFFIANNQNSIFSSHVPFVSLPTPHFHARKLKTPSNESPQQQALFFSFQAWALHKYGESGKTITVTKNKYLRVINILRGMEMNVAENSKLRFWIKSKGLQLGKGSRDFDDADQDILLIPAKVRCMLEMCC